MSILPVSDDIHDVQVHIRRFRQPLGQIQNSLTTFQCLFMVIFDIHIDDMYRSVQRSTSIHEIQTYCIKTPAFASEHHVEDLFSFMPPLRMIFDLSISIEHSQNAICCVSAKLVGHEPLPIYSLKTRIILTISGLFYIIR